MDERRLRLGVNEALYREVNERVRELHDRFDIPDEMIEFVCECARIGCSERIELTIGEYEAVRSNPRRFAICNGHEDGSIEHIVAANDRYATIEKEEGGPAELAEATDPR